MAGMVADMAAGKKMVLADMLLHMGADKEVAKLADMVG